MANLHTIDCLDEHCLGCSEGFYKLVDLFKNSPFALAPAPTRNGGGAEEIAESVGSVCNTHTKVRNPVLFTDKIG